jgi:hypothetical protein
VDQRKKITIKITGGLGNQIFKFMSSFRVACIAEKELNLDLTWYSPRIQGKPELTKRNFELDYFPNLANFKRICTFAPPLDYQLGRLLRRLPNKVLTSLGYCTDDNLDLFEELARVRVMDGNFEDVNLLPPSKKVVQLLDFPDWHSNWLRANLEDIPQQGFIAMHVRLGDYLKFPKVYDVLKPNYYLDSLESVPENLSKLPIWLFSDDLLIAKSVLPSSIRISREVFTAEDVIPGEVLRLMSKAKVIVTAHSTFSWWAGYLGINSGFTEHVTIPKRYLANEVSSHRLRYSRFVSI